MNADIFNKNRQANKIFFQKGKCMHIQPICFTFFLRGKFKLSSIMFIEIQYSLYRRGYARAVSSTAFAVVPHAARAQCVAVTRRAARPPNHKEPLPCHITPYEPLPCHITPIFLFRQGKRKKKKKKQRCCVYQVTCVGHVRK